VQDLTVYYAPTCAFSVATLAFLASRGADWRMVNLEQRPDERARLERALEGRKLETPLLEVGGARHVAPPLSELKELLLSWGLPDEAAPHAQLKALKKKE
jgi:glutaredoxin